MNLKIDPIIYCGFEILHDYELVYYVLSLFGLNIVNAWYWFCDITVVQSIIEMAFFNKLGSLARQSISQKGQVPMVSMLNSIRCMSSSKLFIGGTDD